MTGPAATTDPTGSGAQPSPGPEPPGGAGGDHRPARSGPGSRRRLVAVLALVGLIGTAAALVGLPAKADDVSRTTADEPQYLLSARSLWDDGDLDISDELAARAYEPFHEATLPTQTRPLDDGRQVSPHDPLLPLVLAVPMGLGGWVAAKATLAVLAGVLTALTAWVTHRRFAVRLGWAAGVAAAFAVVPPLATYGTQVYPELPAALVVVAVVGAATARPLRPVHLAVVAVGLVALPWLSVKYAPVVVGLAAVVGVGLARHGRWRPLLALGAVGAVGAVTFAVGHQVLYGGWTAYAAGDHFVDGELTVVGSDPDVVGRSVRLVGLLVDARFGLAAWAPAFVLAVPALAALVRRRPPGWAALVVPLALGWANATWVALTMSGWWWPGRQVVIVVPLIVVAVAWWVDRVAAVRPWLVAATAWGVASWSWLLAEVLGRRRDLIIDFYDTSAPTYRVAAWLLPDTQAPGATDAVLGLVWTMLLVGLAALGWRSGRPSGAPAAADTPSGDDPSPPARPGPASSLPGIGC